MNYAKVFGKHDIAAVVGFEFQNTTLRGLASVGTNVPIGLPLNYNLFDPADVITTREMRLGQEGVFLEELTTRLTIVICSRHQ